MNIPFNLITPFPDRTTFDKVAEGIIVTSKTSHLNCREAIPFLPPWMAILVAGGVDGFETAPDPKTCHPAPHAS